MFSIRNSKLLRLASINPIINLMKLTDSFGRQHDYLRISLTERCNLRCQYCMPEEGIKLSNSDQLLTTEEIKRLTSLFVNNLGFKKIRLTGGEPLIRKDIIQIVDHLNSLKSKGLELITITTNGTVLKRHCSALKNAGLDGLNISLDSLVPAKYQFITRRTNSFQSVMDGILSALDQNFPLPFIKINCVMMKGFNDDELIDFVEFTRDKKVDIRFIEYMPFDSNKWSSKKLLPYEKMIEILMKHYGENFEKILDKNKFNLTSKPFKIRGFEGQIGFITSMTNNFCSTCNRLRITADGNLKVCLFDQKEISLRDELRKSTDDFDLFNIIEKALLKKKAKHSVLSNKNDGQLPKFTHISNGQLNMVDISNKEPSKRIAKSQAKVELGKELFNLIKSNKVEKGDIIAVAKLSGIQAAKRTASLIPLCHQLNLSKIEVDIILNESDYSAKILSTVTLVDRTGAEIESLLCSAITALTLYDMGKSVNKGIKITDLKLIFKQGGKSGNVDFSEN